MLTLEIHAIQNCEEEWKSFEERAVCTPYQQYDWLKSWCDHVAPEHRAAPVIVFGRTNDGDLKFIWPFMLVRRFGVNNCMWLGGKVQNLNSGLYDKEWLQIARKDEIIHYLIQLHELVPNIDVLNLQNQPLSLSKQSNPFGEMDGMSRSVNLFYQLEITADLNSDEAISKTNQKRLNKSVRQIESRIGKIQFDDESKSPSADMEFLLMAKENVGSTTVNKSRISNAIKTFLRDVTQKGIMHLQILNVASKPRAAIAYLHHKQHRTGFMNVMTDDECRRFSPGALAIDGFFHSALDSGVKILDFGLGQEEFKKNYMSPTNLYDWCHAFSWRGRLFKYSFKIMQAAKRTLRNNHQLWGLIKKVRNRVH